MLDKDIIKNINKIKDDYKSSIDLVFRDIYLFNKRISLVFLDSLISSDNINRFILEPLNKIVSNSNKQILDNDLYKFLNSYIASNKVMEVNDFDNLYFYLGNAFSIILIDGYDKAIAVETRKDLTRSISEPITEQTISGPKDSFGENYLTNIGLIRRRIKTKDLVIKEKFIGKESLTKVCMLYMDNIIEEDILKEIEKKLDKIDIDMILDASYIRELLQDKNTLFPMFETSERPDHTCLSLMDGKVCLLIDTSPFSIIIPTFFIDLFHSPEDNYQRATNVSFIRIIRLIAFFLAIITPAFYIAITTYNHETIPITLLVNFAAQRDGVPFPAFIEAVGMALIFEILRESDVRMPSLSGSAISILGAIVLGDAAVTAGIVSPIMVIVIAISAICSLMFSNITMVNAIRSWRFIFMIFATTLGIPGIIFCGFLFIIKLNSTKSFGKPYLFPFAPFNKDFLKNSFLKMPIRKNNKRNPLLTNKNRIRSRL